MGSLMRLRAALFVATTAGACAGGLALLASGVFFVLAVRYGVRP